MKASTDAMNESGVTEYVHMVILMRVIFEIFFLMQYMFDNYVYQKKTKNNKG